MIFDISIPNKQKNIYFHSKFQLFVFIVRIFLSLTEIWRDVIDFVCVCVSCINWLHFPFFFRKGCACRFLYGPETKDDHKSQIEKSLDGKLELKLEVIFYKKDGKWTNDLFSLDKILWIKNRADFHLNYMKHDWNSITKESVSVNHTYCSIFIRLDTTTDIFLCHKC